MDTTTTTGAGRLRPVSLRAGIVIGLALALVGVGVGTATGAVTPFQQVVVRNTAAEPVPVSGTINVGNTPTNQAVTVSNFPSTQAVSGTVGVGSVPAAGAKFYGSDSGTGEMNFPFGKTINITALFVVDGTGDNYDVFIDSYHIAENVENNYSIQFTHPVPATGVQVHCLNLTLDCHTEVIVFGY